MSATPAPDTKSTQLHLPAPEAWLASTTEAAVEPELEIIDAHHHLWDAPRPRYLLNEFLADASGGHRIVSTVYVQCHAMHRAHGSEAEKSLGETEFATGMAAMSASGAYGPTRVCDGIVGYVDLRLPQAGALLQQHKNIAGSRFKGVRNMSAWHPDPGVLATSVVNPKDLLIDPDFRRGLGTLTDLGLVFDAFLFHSQLDDLINLAQTCSATTIVLNHYGTPLGVGPYADQRQAVFSDWSASMARLAEFPNMHVKLGGLTMRVAGFGFEKQPQAPSSDQLAQAWQPYFDCVVQLFGAERCMFESNFPVDKSGCSYTVLWNACKKLCAKLPATDRQALLSETARRIYKL